MLSDAIDLQACRAIQETDSALLVEDDQDHGKWIPKKAVHPDSEVQEVGDVGELILHDWFDAGIQCGSVLSRDRPKPMKPVPVGKPVALNVGPLVKRPPGRK